LALDYFKNTFRVPVIGVIEAGAKKALSVSKNNTIGIIGTRSTINSSSYQKEILKINRHTKIYVKACPLFVPLAEEGLSESRIAAEIVKMYLGEMRNKNIDTVILGCTHYPLLKKPISKYLKGVNIIDSAKEVALYTKDLLLAENLARKTVRPGKREFFVSDEPHGFMKLAKLFLKKDIAKPRVVNV
jgi:glutamate racemase